MREEFKSRRGYDMTPFLPVMTGRVVTARKFPSGSSGTCGEPSPSWSSRTMRDACSELAHQHGLRFTVEAYGSPCDHLPYAGMCRRADGRILGRRRRHRDLPRHGLGRPHLRQADRRRRILHGHRQRAMDAASRRRSRPWATGHSARGSTGSSFTATPSSPGPTAARA